MECNHLFQQIDKHFFLKEESKDISMSIDHKNIDKEGAALKLIQKGETLLLKGSPQGIKEFQKALTAFPENIHYWNHFALCLYEFGISCEDDKALQFASKCYKKSTSIDPNQFDTYLQWGTLLSELALEKDESHFYQRAKEKFQKAIALSDNESKDARAKLYWEYGLCWLNTAQDSGEAVDLRVAIDALKKSEHLQKNPSHDFWIDKGFAYLLMAELINENALYIEAIDVFEKAIASDPNSAVAFTFLADASTGLYINTMDEKHFNTASRAFSHSLKADDNQPDVWLRWAQLYAESGKLNKDAKKLRSSVEKCVKAISFDSNDSEVIAQWVESLSRLGAYTNRLDLLLEAEDKIITATEKNTNHPDLWYAYGICLTSFAEYYDETEFFELAIEKLQCGVSLNRTDAETWQALAYCHSQIAVSTEDPDLFERASKFYRRAIDLKPCCPSLNFEYALNLLKHGDLTIDQDIIEEALLQFEKTIQDQKESLLQHPEWLFHYGCTLDLMGELTEEKSYYIRATEIFLHILLINPDYPCVYHRLALAFSHLAEITTDSHLIERALNYYHLAAKQDPEDSIVFLHWGLSLIHLAHQSIDTEKENQCYLEAEQKMIRSGQLGNQHAYYHLACFYSLTERYQEAMNFIYKAQQYDVLPSVEELVTDDWLDNLRRTKTFEEFISYLESIRQKELP